MNALSKAMIADALCHTMGLSKLDSKEMVDAFFEEIRKNLEMGRHVKLSRFGNFILRDKAERPGRNPRTGQSIPVAARRVVTFKPGLKLKTTIEMRDTKQ